MNWTAYKKQSQAFDESEIKEMEWIAELVKRRKDMGMTQRELAEKTGIHQSAIARLETEGISPKIDTLSRMAKELGLKIELVEEEAAPSQ